MNAPEQTSGSALDPVYRSSEVIFGLLMAMSFIGSISVATDGQEEVRTLLIAALGCNLAWGLVDAVMHLVGTKTQKRRNFMLLGKLRGGADAATGRALLADEMSPPLAASLGEEGLETLRKRLSETNVPAPRPRLTGRDFGDAIVVFFLVVLSTFPLVVPFMLTDDTARALLWSRLTALVMLFFAGAMLARYSGGNAFLNGLVMALVGAALMAAIMALGG
ncbi:MAG TPA: VIT1/CCC1 transporter family protein [Steroidobacteraceae bacterium]|nr:VIT1/CCC1 transporter family protein [Steroidobacteraceae bacterium]